MAKPRPKRIIINKFVYGSRPDAGKLPSERDLSEKLDFGFFLLDKDSGPTSFKAAQRAARIAGAKKAGHSGTLDPKVTGLLVIGTGRGTRLLRYLLEGGKEYRGTMRLNLDINREKLLEAFEHFTGVIEQMPPVRSRVKRELRKREIYGFSNIEQDGRDVHFTVSCEGGTYIRKLCHDMGEYLGCNGHMTGLRRLRVGSFRIEDAVTEVKLEELAKDEEALRVFVRPAEEIVPDLPRIYLADHAVRLVAGGIPVKVKGIESFEENAAPGKEAGVFTLKEELVGIGTPLVVPSEAKDDPDTVLIRIDTCFMSTERYPHYSEYLPPENGDGCTVSNNG